MIWGFHKDINDNDNNDDDDDDNNIDKDDNKNNNKDGNDNESISALVLNRRVVFCEEIKDKDNMEGKLCIDEIKDNINNHEDDNDDNDDNNNNEENNNNDNKGISDLGLDKDMGFSQGYQEQINLKETLSTRILKLK